VDSGEEDHDEDDAPEANEGGDAENNKGAGISPLNQLKTLMLSHHEDGTIKAGWASQPIPCYFAVVREAFAFQLVLEYFKADLKDYGIIFWHIITIYLAC